MLSEKLRLVRYYNYKTKNYVFTTQKKLAIDFGQNAAMNFSLNIFCCADRKVERLIDVTSFHTNVCEVCGWECVGCPGSGASGRAIQSLLIVWFALIWSFVNALLLQN